MLKNGENHPRCVSCGGAVTRQKGKGRYREYLRGVHMHIPDDYEIPTCVGCGEMAMGLDVTGPLDDALHVLLVRELNHKVRLLGQWRGASHADVEEALGVQWNHLSRVLCGQEQPSAMMVKMIDLFMNVPGALEHSLGRKTTWFRPEKHDFDNPSS